MGKTEGCEGLDGDGVFIKTRGQTNGAGEDQIHGFFPRGRRQTDLEGGVQNPLPRGNDAAHGGQTQAQAHPRHGAVVHRFRVLGEQQRTQPGTINTHRRQHGEFRGGTMAEGAIS